MKTDLKNELKLEKDADVAKYDEFVYIVTKSIYALKLSECAFRLFDDKSFKALHASYFPSLAMLNLLLLQNKYDDVVHLFEKLLDYFPKMTVTRNQQPIPAKHLTLVCEALLLKKDKAAFDKLKQIVDVAYQRSSKLDNIGVMCSFLLAIHHNQIDYAAKLTQMMDDRSSLKSNLQL